MSIMGGAVAMGRSMAESLMSDSCIIQRKSATSVNEETLEVSQTVTTIYEGICRLTMQSTSVRDAESGSRVLLEQGARLDVPISGTSQIEPDDIVTFTQSEFDSSLVNRKFRISGVNHQSQATARRFPVTEVTQ